MANISTYLEEAILNHVMRNTEYVRPAVVYVGLVTADAVDADLEAGTLTDEVTLYTGDRKAVTFAAPVDVAGKSTIKNSGAIDFENMPAVTVKYAIVCDAATGGNILYWCPLTVQKTTNAGDTFRIIDEGLVLDLD
jgi:hypothetical protein